MDLGIASRVAIICGGSRGIGLGIAHALGAAGCRLLLLARDGDELDVHAKRFATGGVEVVTMTGDLTDVSFTHTRRMRLRGALAGSYRDLQRPLASLG